MSIIQKVNQAALPISRDDIEAIATGRHADPFAVLGCHPMPNGGASFVVFRPDAHSTVVVDPATDAEILVLDRLDQRGVFAGVLDCPLERYRLRGSSDGHSFVWDDPYRFGPTLGELDRHLISEGTHRRIYDVLGAHPATIDQVRGVRFAVWAPNARRVSVIGLFNGWDGRRHPMRQNGPAGVWDIFIPGLTSGDIYKFELLDAAGNLLPAKADPFGRSHEVPPATASIVTPDSNFDWQDSEWMKRRGERQSLAAPISIYEVHLGSWRLGPDKTFLHYDRLAEELVAYVIDMGFTHVELMPIAEFPFGGSWGYQPVGLFAPTSRFGSPEAFARFVDHFHRAGIGVLCDWVPAHFPNDAHGLARFDGTALYEHEDPRRGFHKDWNTLIFNYGRREVANFLESNARFWLEHFHIDGLRVDAVASMLYLDYSRNAGEWLPNEHGGRENLEAIAFLRDMNSRVYAEHPGAITVAEESTAWPGVSRPVDGGGLGFGYKWNMGWMHDTLDYIANDPVHRRYHHNKLTFGIQYAWNENFVLPISHDEVVHGKKSLLGKMPGDDWQRFANMRAYLGFMWAHPGKKLLFMGCEFAQDREWNHDEQIDWHLLANERHRGVQTLVRDLNRLYRREPALHQRDCDAAGFRWIDGGNADQSVVSFIRAGFDGARPAVVVCNFTPVVRNDFDVGVPLPGRWLEALNTDAAIYGGTDTGNGGAAEARNMSKHGQPYSMRITLPPLAVLIFIAE